jgi:antitoxin component HigA of HigAB toxin-antitoxin module
MEVPLRRIESAAAYERAAAMIDRLAMSPKLSRGEQLYLDALIVFVQAYDEREQPLFGKISPLEMLKSLMEHRGMTSAELGKLLGSKGAASEILHGKRGISKSYMAKLAAHFGVDAGVFL